MEITKTTEQSTKQINFPILGNTKKLLRQPLLNGKSRFDNFLEGTITGEELAFLNIRSSLTYPTRNAGSYNQKNQSITYYSNSSYATRHALYDLGMTIIPALSDRQLFIMTEQLAKDEVKGEDNPYRGSTSLAGIFLIKELERHLIKMKQSGEVLQKFPESFVFHLANNVPLSRKKVNSIDLDVNYFKNFISRILFSAEYLDPMVKVMLEPENEVINILQQQAENMAKAIKAKGSEAIYSEVMEKVSDKKDEDYIKSLQKKLKDPTENFMSALRALHVKTNASQPVKTNLNFNTGMGALYDYLTVTPKANDQEQDELNRLAGDTLVHLSDTLYGDLDSKVLVQNFIKLLSDFIGNKITAKFTVPLHAIVQRYFRELIEDYQALGKKVTVSTQENSNMPFAIAKSVGGFLKSTFTANIEGLVNTVRSMEKIFRNKTVNKIIVEADVQLLDKLADNVCQDFSALSKNDNNHQLLIGPIGDLFSLLDNLCKDPDPRLKTIGLKTLSKLTEDVTALFKKQAEKYEDEYMVYAGQNNPESVFDLIGNM